MEPQLSLQSRRSQRASRWCAQLVGFLLAVASLTPAQAQIRQGGGGNGQMFLVEGVVIVALVAGAVFAVARQSSRD